MDEQVAECNAEAERRGWTVAETYIDRNKSASKAGTVRPDYERLLADIEGGRVSRLLVYMTDRLYRQPRELEDLIDLVDPKKGGHAVEFATVRSGTFDLSTPEGRAFARNAGTWNKLESEKTSEQVRRTRDSPRGRAAERRRPTLVRVRPSRATGSKWSPKRLRCCARQWTASSGENRTHESSWIGTTAASPRRVGTGGGRRV